MFGLNLLSALETEKLILPATNSPNSFALPRLVVKALRKEVKEELGEITENMVVWYDALAIGKTREKVMELVEKDK